MKFTLHSEPKIQHSAPFHLFITFHDLRRKTQRKRFACGYKALAALHALKLDPAVHCGADVLDDNGAKLAEWE